MASQINNLMVTLIAERSASEIINVRSLRHHTTQQLYIFWIGLLVSSISCLYVPSFKILRTNLDSDPNVQMSNQLTSLIPILPTGGLPRIWAAQENGNHSIHDANTGQLLSNVYSDYLGLDIRVQILLGLDKGYVGFDYYNRSHHLNLQFNGSAYSFTGIANYTTALRDIRATLQISGTNFIIRSAKLLSDKLNFDTQTVDINFSTANPGKSWHYVDFSIIEEIPNSNDFYCSMTQTTTYVMDRTSMVIQREFFRSGHILNNQWTSFRLDNINNSHLYIFDDSSKQFCKYDHTTNPVSLLDAFPITGVTQLRGYIHNFGSEQYVFSVLVDKPTSFNSSLMMLTKSTSIQQVDVLVPFNTVVMEFASAIYYDTATQTLLLALCPLYAPYLLQTYKILFQGCITRDATNTCTECSPSFYFSDPNPNNECWLKQDFLPGFGANDPDLYVQACTLANCGNCRDNYSVCMNCKAGFYHTQASGAVTTCYTDAELPISGRGKNGTQSYLPPCSLSGCESCAASYLVCTACLSTLYYTENPPGTITGCYDYPNIPTTHGINGAAKLLNNCNVSFCINCKDNYNICLDCATTHYYKESHPGTKAQCYASVGIPDGWGKNGAANKLEPCTVAGCLTCSNTYTTCISCESALWYKEADPATKLVCYDNSIRPIPDGFGNDSPNKLLKACTLTTCKVCSADYDICNECPVDRWYTATPITACYLTSEIPAGKGKNPGIQLLNDCSVSGCNECSDIFSNCNTCQTTPTLTYYIEATGPKSNCYATANIPGGYGIDGASQLLSSCSVSGCGDCKADISQCNSCFSNLWTNQSGPLYTNCYYNNSIPDGWGKDGSNQLLKTCSDSAGCQVCKESYQSCETCKSNHWYIQATGNKVCYLEADIPSGWGKNSSNFQLAACQAQNCENCKASYTECHTCLSSHPYYKEAAPFYSNCYNNTSIPSNWGKNGASLKLEPCSLSTCDDCVSAYTSCISCQSAYYYTVPFSNCFDSANITSEYGINGTSKRLELCSVNNCIDCKANYTGCTQCNTGYWYKEPGIKSFCYLPQDIPFSWGKSAIIGQLAQCSAVNCSDCKENYTQCLACLPGNYLKEELGFKSGCYLYDHIPSGYGIVNQFFIGLCRVTGCNNCKAKYSDCVSCNSDRFYIEDISFKSYCYLEADTPVGFGMQAGTKLLKRCQTTNCKSCKFNYTLCDSCHDAFYYKEPTGVKSECLASENIPEGWGIQEQSNLLKECSLAGCHNCSMNYSVCIPCTGLWYAQTPGQLTGCYRYADIPAGMGVVSPNLVAPCKVTGCIDCKANSTYCVTCDPSRYFMEDNDFKKNCYNSTSIPDGYGAQSRSNLLKACTTPNCRACQTNHSQCSSCKDGYFYKEPLGFKESCITENNIPNGWGKQGSIYLLASCTATGCKNCTANHSVCVSCHPNMWHYGSADMPAGCFNDYFISSRYGKKAGTYLLEPCRVDGCYNCWSDYNDCLTCLPDRFHKEVNSYKQICYTLPQIPVGYGRQEETTIISPCRVKDCKLCQSDINVCQECLTNRWLVKDDDRNLTSCVVEGSFPVGWGKVNGTYKLSRCKGEGCLSCFEDYSTCTGCGPDGWYTGTLQFPKACYSENDIPFGLGKNGTEKLLVSCNLAGCGYCKENYMICQECQKDRYHKESRAPISQCYLYSEITLNYGIVSSSQQISTCTTPNCKQCLKNYEKCEACEDNYYYILHSDSSLSCYSSSDIPSRYGKNSTQKQLASCENKGCKDCVDDYRKCSTCLESNWYFDEPDGTKTCYPIEAVPSGYGKDTGYRILKCTTENCGDCYADYTVCLACSDDTFMLDLFVPRTKCLTIDQIPSGLGIKKGQQLLVSCSIPNCPNCSLDYETCVKCEPHQYYSEALADFKYCYEPTSLPIRFGKKEPTEKFLIRCTDTRCQSCFEDYGRCTGCIPTNYYLKLDDYLVCYSRSEIPDYYGVNGIEKLLEPCELENCQKCQEHYSICTECKEGFYLYNDRCIPEIPAPRDEARDVAGTKRGLLDMKFNPEKKSLAFTFDTRVSRSDLENVSSLLKLMGFVNMETKQVIRFPPLLQSPPIKFTENGFELLINLGDFDGPFELMLEDNSGLGYLKENMVIKGLNYAKKEDSSITENTIRSLVYGFSVTLTYTRLAVNFVGGILTQSLSIFLYKMCSNWNLILLTGKEYASTTDYYLGILSKMQTYNPWNSQDITNCGQGIFLEDRNIACEFEIRFGSELFYFYIILAFCLIVQLISWVFKKNARLSKLSSYFGLSFWMRRTHAFFLQVLLLAMIHMKYKEGGVFTVSFILYCIPLLVYYLFAFGLVAWRTWVHYKEMKEQSKKVTSETTVYKFKITTGLDFGFEDMNIKNLCGLLLPLAYQIRCVALAVLTVTLIGSPIPQIVAVLVVETSYFVMLSIGKPFKYNIVLFLEKVNSLQVIALVSVKLYSLNLLISSPKWISISRYTDVALLGMYFLCLLLTVYMVVSPIKQKSNVDKDRKLENMLDKPIEALNPTIRSLKYITRQADNMVFVQNYKDVGHLNLYPDDK